MELYIVKQRAYNIREKTPTSCDPIYQNGLFYYFSYLPNSTEDTEI